MGEHGGVAEARRLWNLPHHLRSRLLVAYGGHAAQGAKEGVIDPFFAEGAIVVLC